MNNPPGRRAFHTSVRMARCRSAQWRHIRRRPLGNGGGVFAEHAFSRTRDIGGNDVEVFFECAECRGFVAGDYAIGRSPFDNIFGEDMRPVGYDFVADD